MNNNKLILHAVIMHKPHFKTPFQALSETHKMFPHESTKNYVRETPESFRVRIKPKQHFVETSFVSKVINPNITLVFGHLKDNTSPIEPKTHYIDFNKIQKYKKPLP